MKKRIKKFFTLMMALAMSVSLVVPASATSAYADNGFQVNLTPNGAQQTRGQIIPMELNIQLSSYTYEHDSVVDADIHLVWEDSHNWDVSLNGNAVVYNIDNNPILVGSAHGYNGSTDFEDFIGLNFTYNVNNGHCIATVTYDYSESNPYGTRVTFGKNDGEFDEALFAVNARMDDDTISSPGLNDSSQEASIQPRGINRTSKSLGTANNHNGAVQLSAWAYAEFEPSGTDDIAASLKGNEAAAENIIVNNVDTTATYTAARTCEILYTCSENARFSRSEYLPIAKSTAFEIDVPIPYTYQSYTLRFTLNSIDVTPPDEQNKRQILWEMKNNSMDGITELFNTGNSGVGAFNLLHYNTEIEDGDTDRVTVQVNGVIGYDYMFVDPAVGGFNNSTWYAYASVSGTVTCNNT